MRKQTILGNFSIYEAIHQIAHGFLQFLGLKWFNYYLSQNPNSINPKTRISIIKPDKPEPELC